MKKKNIFIIIAMILVVTVVVLYFVLSKKTVLPNDSASLNSNTNVGSAVPQLSTGTSDEVAQGAILPQDIENQIKGNIESAKNTESKVSEVTAKNSSGKNISFQSFLQSSGLKMDESVLRLSDQAAYKVFNCSVDSSNASAGLIFEVNKSQDLKSYLGSVDLLTGNVKKWESKMFQDLSPLFFPGEFFSQVPNFNEVRFDTSNGINSVVIRFANSKSESGKTFSIDWSIFNNQIFISNDKDCLRKILNEHQDKLEP